MCAVAAIGPAVSAIGRAAQASAANRAAKRDYEYKLKVRERNWMQTRSTYQSKKVQFDQEVDLANIAAQRAYTRTQIQLNNARSLAILENQEDFKKMLANEGMIEASAAERGIRGKSLAKQLVQNSGNFGIAQALRSRGLATAQYQGKEAMADVNRQLKTQLNRSFSKVAIAPIQDFVPPPPQMQSPGLVLMMGMANALGEGLGGMEGKGDGLKMNQGAGDYSYSNIGATPTYNPNFISQAPAMPSNPAFGFGKATDNFVNLYN